MKKTIYGSEHLPQKSFFSLFREMVDELATTRWLTWQFIKKDFVATYEQSLLGVFWAIVLPLAAVGTFILLRNSGILNVGDIKVPYPLFALIGMTGWQIFSTGILASSTSLVKSGTIIQSTNFPKEPLVISSLIVSIFSSIIQFFIVGLLFLFYGVVPHWTLILFPFTLIPLFFLTLGLGFVFSIINGVIRDIRNILSVSITFLLFLTPVLYEKPRTEFLEIFSQCNPLYYLISVPRDLLLFGYTINIHGYLFSVLLSIVVFLVCWMVFHLSETKIAERI